MQEFSQQGKIVDKVTVNRVEEKNKITRWDLEKGDRNRLTLRGETGRRVANWKFCRNSYLA